MIQFIFRKTSVIGEDSSRDHQSSVLQWLHRAHLLMAAVLGRAQWGPTDPEIAAWSRGKWGMPKACKTEYHQACLVMLHVSVTRKNLNWLLSTPAAQAKSSHIVQRKRYLFDTTTGAYSPAKHIWGGCVSLWRAHLETKVRREILCPSDVLHHSSHEAAIPCCDLTFSQLFLNGFLGLDLKKWRL